jgi:hypothetical protein
MAHQLCFLPSGIDDPKFEEKSLADLFSVVAQVTQSITGPKYKPKLWLTTNWLPFAQHVSKNFNNNLAK